MPVLGLGRSSAGSLGERLEEAAPVAFSVKDATHLITTRPVKVETAMLELDARSVLAVGDESQLEIRLQTWVVLPVRGDLPLEPQTRGRFPQGAAAPVTRASIVTTLVPAPPNPRVDPRHPRVHRSNRFIHERS